MLGIVGILFKPHAHASSAPHAAVLVRFLLLH
jgi:hypothetical protein